MARLFVAVWPPAEVVTALEAIDRPVLAGVGWTSEDKWHVTMRFLGEADEDAAGDALATIVHEPVDAVLGGTMGRLGGSALVVPVDGLESLAATVDVAFEGIGRRSEHGRFSGHLTLARTRDTGRVAVPAVVVDEHRWRIDEVTLVRSALSPQGAGYTVVRRARLR